LNYVVLLCIEFVILLIEEKVMSYVTVSEGHGYPLGFYNKRSLVVSSCVLHYEKLGCLIPCFVMGEAWLQPKKKKKGGQFMGGDFPKMFGKEGGGSGAGQA
jgi:hypothetical protein